METPSHQSALGSLVIAFNELEEALTIGLAELTSLDYPTAAAIFGSTSFRHKARIIWAVANLNSGDRPNLDNLQILLKQASRIEDARNGLLHSSWPLYTSQEGVQRRREKVRYSKGRGSEILSEKLNIEEIDSVSASCNNCVVLLEYWFMQGDFQWWEGPLPWGLTDDRN